MRLLVVAFLLCFPVAHADPGEPGLAFSQGRYTEAASLALQNATADNYAFAARAHLADAMSSDAATPPDQLITQAEAEARQALALDPDHVDARLQLAIALSLKARPLGNAEALRKGWGEDARDLAEAVLKEDPENFYAHGFLAVWHLEVVRRGGALGAAMFGASIRKAREHYWQTRAIRDGDPATSWQYARSLAALDARKHQDEIRSVLLRAVEGEARSALEETMQQRATRLLQTMDTGQLAEVQKRAREQL